MHTSVDVIYTVRAGTGKTEDSGWSSNGRSHTTIFGSIPTVNCGTPAEKGKN